MKTKFILFFLILSLNNLSFCAGVEISPKEIYEALDLTNKINPNFYEILGVKQDSSEEEIKKNYHKLRLKWHPDKNTDKRLSEAVFKTINNAYSKLTNPRSSRSTATLTEDSLFRAIGIEDKNQHGLKFFSLNEEADLTDLDSRKSTFQDRLKLAIDYSPTIISTVQSRLNTEYKVAKEEISKEPTSDVLDTKLIEEEASEILPEIKEGHDHYSKEVLDVVRTADAEQYKKLKENNFTLWQQVEKIKSDLFESIKTYNYKRFNDILKILTDNKRLGLGNEIYLDIFVIISKALVTEDNVKNIEENNRLKYIISSLMDYISAPIVIKTITRFVNRIKVNEEDPKYKDQILKLLSDLQKEYEEYQKSGGGKNFTEFLIKMKSI